MNFQSLSVNQKQLNQTLHANVKTLQCKCIPFIQFRSVSSLSNKLDSYHIILIYNQFSGKVHANICFHMSFSGCKHLPTFNSIFKCILQQLKYTLPSSGKIISKLPNNKQNFSWCCKMLLMLRFSQFQDYLGELISLLGLMKELPSFLGPP